MPVLDWKELQSLNEQRQKGVVLNDNFADYAARELTPDDIQAAKNRLASYANTVGDARKQALRLGQDAYSDYVASLPDDDEYGRSRYDSTVNYEDWIQDPINYRANAQSSGAKLGNGALKLIPYAGTTFLDNTLGLAAGLLNAGVDAANGDGFRPVDSFINNPFSEAMQDVRDWSERVFPNYRTTEETEDQDRWWRHLNANFWGDTFLKNLGFTIGAGAAGAAYAGAYRALQPKIVNKAYKAAVAAALDGDAAAEEAFRKVLQGGAVENPKKIYDALNAASKSYRKLSARSQLIGGLGGAVGESRVEAMNAAKEYRDASMDTILARYEQAKQALNEEVNSTPEYFEDQEVYDGYGNLIGYRPTLNAAGRQALAAGQKDLLKQYSDEMTNVDNEATQLANTTFWLNMPLLWGSNVVMFGRMFSGGFKTQAKMKVGGPFGNYYGTGSAASAVAKGLGNAAVEGMEELSQKVISEGAKTIAERNSAAFHNGKYDEDSIKNISEWLMSMGETAGEVVTDPTSWQEFAVGFLTGALGMPSHAGVSNWSGGIIGGIQEGLEEREASRKAAEDLNAEIAKPEFQELFSGLVRHNYYETRKDAALAENDQFAWHSDNDKQILSDVMMFANVGRLNELEEYVDSFANISLEEVANLRSTFVDETKDPNTGEIKNALADNTKTDYEIQAWLKDRANSVKRAIRQYRDFHDSVNVLSLGTTDEEVIDELVYTQAQLQNFEDRYRVLSKQVIDKIRPTIENISRERTKEGTPTKRAEQASKILSSADNIQRLFGGYAIDLKARAQDEHPDANAFTAYMLDDVRQKQVLDELQKWGAFTDDAETKKEVSDLQKLVRSRQNFYAKLFDPTFRQSYEKDAKTVQTTVDDIQEKERVEKSMRDTAGLTTVSDMTRAYLSSEDRPSFVESVRTKAKTDPEAAEFTRLVDTYNNYKDKLVKYNPKLVNRNTGGLNYVAEMLLNDMLKLSNSEKEFINNLEAFDSDYDMVVSAVQQMVEAGILSEDAALPLIVDKLYNDTVTAIQDTRDEFIKNWKSTEGDDYLPEQETSSEEKKSVVDDNDNPEPSVKPSESEKKETAEKPNTPEASAHSETQPVMSDDVPEAGTVPTVEEVAGDTYSNYVDNSLPEKDAMVSDDNSKTKLGYYQQSIPEIPISAEKQVRNAIIAKKNTTDRDTIHMLEKVILNTNLSDFVTFDDKGNPTGGQLEYAETYKWLKDNGAFDYIATKLKQDAEVVIALTEDTPKYEGKPQFVVATVAERNAAGEITRVQPLTILHSAERENHPYVYLDELYDALLADYDATSPDGSLYVFGGKVTPHTSKVFDIRPGLVRYNNNPDAITRIDKIDSYDPNNPIIILDENNRPVFLRGKVDPDKVFVPNVYPWSTPQAHYGRIYYLTKNGNDTYTPVFVDRETISSAMIQNAPDGGFLAKVRTVVGKIDKLTEGVNLGNLDKSDNTLRDYLRELNELVDLNGIYFQYQKVRTPEGNDAAMLVVTRKENENEPIFLSPGQSILPLFDIFSRTARLSPKGSWLSASVSNLDGIIADGLLTSSATKLRQVGVNFTFDPWNPKANAFGRILPSNAAVTTNTEKGIPRGQTRKIETDAELGMSSDDYNALKHDNPVEAPVNSSAEQAPDLVDFDAVVPEDADVSASFEDLSESALAILNKHGISSAEWNQFDETVRRKILGCR